MRKKSIFISYSWDSPEHKAWVKKLSDDLQARLGDNFEVLLDQNMPKGISLTRFMKLGIENSEKVLVIGTPGYKAKAFHGNGLEQIIIANEIINNIDTTKFYPILREGNFAESFPPALLDRIGVDFRDDTLYEEKLQRVVINITNDNPLPDIIKLDSIPVSTEKVAGKTLESQNDNHNTTDDFTFENYPNQIYKNAISNILDNSIGGVEYSEDMTQLIRVPKNKNDNFIILDSVTEICNNAFEGCDCLTSIVIPNSVTKIGDFAFWGCKSLTSINIPNGVTKIGQSVFQDCTSLISLKIPDSVTQIEEGAFSGCTGLISVKIPDSVTQIGGNAFSGCTSLISVKIPDSVTQIGGNAFSGCTSLTPIMNQRIMTYYDIIHKYEKSLGKNMTTSEINAFDGLKKMNPDCITKIEDIPFELSYFLLNPENKNIDSINLTKAFEEVYRDHINKKTLMIKDSTIEGEKEEKTDNYLENNTEANTQVKIVPFSPKPEVKNSWPPDDDHENG